MRQLPGVELFRRSSSLVANPTSQGISLRGLGSTSASRTLVTEDDVPLNDPLGGWIHWQEQPELSIQSVELVRGGASDLYGSSAIGGVVNVIPVRPTSNQAELQLQLTAAKAPTTTACWPQLNRGPWGLLAAGGLIGTDGYIQEAPSQRGPVDVASNVHSQNGLVFADRDLRRPQALRARQRLQRVAPQRHSRTRPTAPASALRHRRRLAKRAQCRARPAPLRIDRALSPDLLQHLQSAQLRQRRLAPIAAAKRRRKFSYVPDNELGAAAHWSQPFGAGLLFVAGADAHDVRVWDREQTYSGTAALTNLADHQRDSAAYG